MAAFAPTIDAATALASRADRGRASGRVSKQGAATLRQAGIVGAMPSDVRDPSEAIPVCPVCLSGPLKFSRRMRDLDICICESCETSMTVPHEAWKKRPAVELK